MPVFGNAVDASIGNAYTASMEAVRKAVECLGSQAALAAALNVTQPTVSEWARGERPVPIPRCLAIEVATGGKVSRMELRPNDWHLIWPDQAGMKVEA